MPTTTQIGPANCGRKMTLDEFADSQAVPGCCYELGRGVVAVEETPNPSDAGMQHAVLKQLYAFDAMHSGIIQLIAPRGSSKMRIDCFESERYPDIAIYKTIPPTENNSVWDIWVPEFVIEIVTPNSLHRDYIEKPEEYLQFGVREYWIIDADRAEIVVHRRVNGRWKKQTVKPPEEYSTHILPELSFSCEAVFEDAAK